MSYPRNLTSLLKSALTDCPVILLNGARQTGKSTLVEAFSYHKESYITLDDMTLLMAAQTSPTTFIENLPKKIAIDEIQRAPELFLPIKKSVDEERIPGRFLLTGSANVMALPKLADSLAGRMEIYTLWPLSQGEIAGKQEGFVDAVFEKEFSYQKVKSISQSELLDRITLGGYPEILTRASEQRRNSWYQSYITTLMQKDVRDLAQIENLAVLPALLNLLATRAGGLINFADLARLSQIPMSTIKRYIALFEALFLVIRLPAWFASREKRLVKSPKLYLNDTGLLAYLQQVDVKQLEANRNLLGFLLENFVVMELIKQIGWSKSLPTLYHFRTQAGQEVDLVLETRNGQMVGIEVKASSIVYASDFNGLKALQALVGKKFQRGIILYTGEQVVSFGEDLLAMPISALWELNVKPSFNIFK